MRLDTESLLDPQVAQALSSLTYGLYLLTAGTPQAPLGMLVSWVGQVSGDPVMLLAAVRHNRPLLPELEQQGAFCLNLLPGGDQRLLAQLARPASSRLLGQEFAAGPLGLPVLAAGLGGICCKLREVWRPGDHALLLGTLAGVRWRGGGPAMNAGETGHAYLGLS